jgi:dTDP-4-dehydrorhamnose reductase
VTPRVLLLGGNGQVGRQVQQLTPVGWTAPEAPSSTAVDLRQRERLRDFVRAKRPSIVINCAAYTDVDRAERERDDAMAVNADAPEVLGEAAREMGFRVIHVSTDFVFGNDHGVPHDIADTASPSCVYGESKWLGERRLLAADPAAVVIRTAWVHSATGRNFVRTVVERLRAGQPVSVVDDQVGTPTAAASLAAAIWRVIERPELSGVLHFTDAGVASRFDVACVIGEELQARGMVPGGCSITPSKTTAGATAATRPACAILDKHSTWARLGWIPPHWPVGVRATIQELLNG